MLHKINKVQGFGILDNFKPESAVKPFNKFNVIYGWNGSGKTTLARLFRCLETKSNNVNFKEAEFIIELDNNTKIDSKTNIHDQNIKVFNQDFIKENLDLFEAQTKPIIFISKEKVDEKKELDKQKNELNGIAKKIADLTKEEATTDKLIDDFHKDAGKSIKDFLLGTIYANVTYNKATSAGILKDLLSKEEDIDSFILSVEKLVIEKNYTISNSKKEEVQVSSLPIIIDIEKLLEIEKDVNKLITANITSKVISRLKDKPDIGEWVAQGLAIHNHHKSETCEFCNQELPADRIENLEAHYNKQYAELIESITELIGKVEKGIRTELVPQKHLIYEQLSAQYDEAILQTNNKLGFINLQIREWINLLNAKKQNPFAPIEKTITDRTIFENFNAELETLKSVIEQHNEISKTHKSLSEQAKKKIEYHFVSEAAVTKNLSEIEAAKEAIKANIIIESTASNGLKTSIKNLEDELRSDTLAIGEINTSLHKFLGRNDITLIPQDEGGYQLIRGKIAATNLSEGEKTAISLIYFFSKIKENDADIKNQIVILDDPISSFDSNHLFNASSIIKQSTNGAKQLFVLTHNFWFFKQVRDWMLKKNDHKNNLVVSNIYLTKQGVLSDAQASLIKFHSEYHYVFNSVLSYQDFEGIDDNLCFTIANSIRRLLEAFTSFKTPANSGFEGALSLGIKKGLTVEQKERIFYFVNKYSHLDRIESFDTTIETLFEEGKNVVTDVLWLIKKVDEEHYKSMLKVCEFEDKLVN